MIIQLSKVNFCNDIYFKDNYRALYLNEGDEIFTFEYERGDKYFKNTMIKRPISKVGDVIVESGIFDAETAYGYGGPETNIISTEELSLVKKKYDEHCEKHNVIASFFRLHPFIDYNKMSEHFFDFINFSSDVVVVDTTIDREKRWSTYNTKTRNILRRCYKNLEIKKSSNVSEFISMYQKTMNKNSASNFYYFEETYFRDILDIENVQLYKVMLDDTTISMGIFMHSNHIMHYHLSANDYKYSKHNGNYLLLDYLADEAYQLGCKFFLLGGGRTNEVDDSLLKFKKKFSRKSLAFYIGGIVHNKCKYDQLNSIWESQNPNYEKKYFQKYRL